MDKLTKIPTPLTEKVLCSADQYKKLYQKSIENPEAFWGEQAKRLEWNAPWTKVKDCSFKNNISIRWYEGGKLNASYNCIDRHLKKNGNKVALIFEPDNPNESSYSVTYYELYEKVCRLSNVLKNMGVKKGDRVTLYMPMIPEAVYSMLACSRIGAIHSVVFGGFSPKSLGDRIKDCESEYLITTDEAYRGGKIVPLKKNADEALESLSQIKKVLVVKRTGGSIQWNSQRDIWYHEALQKVSKEYPPEIMDSEDPLFILYTSGSTGKPKGVLHTTGGYLVYVSLSFEYIFNYHPEDVFWCTADVGWVTGHSYIVYGPLLNAATVLIYEGIPTYPSYSRNWQIIDKHKVNIYYTAPTALRTLMQQGDAPLNSSSRMSLKILGSVGEPINPEAWKWYFEKVGKDRCPIVDTWWQTETGGILLSPFPGALPLKPGAASLPFFGIVPCLVNEKGEELEGVASGELCIKESWPGQARTVYKDHERFIKTYFTTYPGKFLTGDGCYRDEDGYYWVTGRVDDVIKVSGHRIGSAEIENALVGHAGVSEAAVVGFPHEIKGEGIYAFVTLEKDHSPSNELKNELNQWVRKELGPICSIDSIHWAPALPKTRSGKIMRRILRKIALGDIHSLGDTTTLADPSIVQTLIDGRGK